MKKKYYRIILKDDVKQNFGSDFAEKLSRYDKDLFEFYSTDHETKVCGHGIECNTKSRKTPEDAITDCILMNTIMHTLPYGHLPVFDLEEVEPELTKNPED